MEDSRTQNTLRNIYAGLLNQFVSIVLPFINRTIILWTLGAEFTGLSGLFTSILGVLGVAELGFNSAIVYSLYEPMAKHDEKQICQIVSIFRKIYNIIGTVIFILGMITMPFLKYFINGTCPNSINLYMLYFLYLLNSVVGYYMYAYKECILIADQRKDLAQNMRTFVNIIRYITQFIVLILTKDFYAYMLIAIIGTVVTNLGIQYLTTKKYPFYKKINGKMFVPKELITQVKGLFIEKICDTFRNSFDSLIISSFIGLTAAAIYGNYYYIYSAIYSVMLTISGAMTASIGNSIITKSVEENYNDLRIFSAIFAIIFGVCTVCLICLYQPFMLMWAGENLLLSTKNMILFGIYFYVINMNNIRNNYIAGNGMWWYLKKSYIMEAITNLLLNFLLAQFMGITGVLLATIITIFVFNYLQRNRILFKHYFNSVSYHNFLLEQFYYVIVTIVATVVAFLVSSLINGNTLWKFCLKGIVSIIIGSGILLLGILPLQTGRKAWRFILYRAALHKAHKVE